MYCCNIFFPYPVFWWFGSWKFYISGDKITSDNLIICCNDFNQVRNALIMYFFMWIVALKINVLNFVVISAFSDFNNKRLNPPILLNYFATPITSPTNKKTFHKLLRRSLTHIKKKKKNYQKNNLMIKELSDFAVKTFFSKYIVVL